MTLHRPTNLMGTAAYHEVGEHLANPIAAGAKPLTAEERAARRKRYEDEKKPARMRADPAEFVKEAMGVLSPWQEGVMRAPHAPNYAALSDLTKEVVRQQRDLARSMDLSRYIVGIDRAKPDSEATVIVEPRVPKRYFWYAPTSEELERAAKLTKWPESYQLLLTHTK